MPTQTKATRSSRLLVAIQPSPVGGKRILFINAGSRKKRVTFEEAVRLGLSITLVHPGRRTYADAYCDARIDSTGKSAAEIIAEIRAMHKKQPFDGVITFWEDDVEFTAEVANRLHLIGNSSGTAKIARNKFLMRDCLRRAGVAVPQARLVKTLAEAKVAAATIGFPLVMKPVKGMDSFCVTKVMNERELEKTFVNFTKYAKYDWSSVVSTMDPSTYVIEEYLPGSEVSAEVLVQNGTIWVVGIIDKLPMAEPYFIERGDVCPSRHPVETQERIRELTKKTIEAIGMQNGIAHVEIKLTPDGPKTIEVGARMGGEYICDWMETVYGVSLAREGLLIALGSPIDMTPRAPHAYLRGEIFIPEEDSVVKIITGLDELKKSPQAAHVQHIYIWAHKGDTLLAPPRGFDTAGWVVTLGKNAKQADERMKSIRKLVQIEYEPVAKHKGARTDIVQPSLRHGIGFPIEPQQIIIREIKNRERAHELWNLFVRLREADSPFLDWEFRDAFARGYGSKILFLLAETPARDPIGLLPLQYVSDRKQWEFFGTYWFEDNIFFADSEIVLRQLLAAAPRPLWLSAIAHTELRRFQSLPLDFDEEKFILPLHQSDTIDTIYGNMSSQKINIIRKIKQFTVLRPKISRRDRTGAFEELVSLNNKQFGQDHSLSPARIRAMKHLYSSSFSGLKRRVITLSVKGEIAAVGLALYSADRYLYVLAGCDTERFSTVDLALTLELISDAMKLGCKKFDALAGDFGWKSYWGFSPEPLYFLAIDEMDGAK